MKRTLAGLLCLLSLAACRTPPPGVPLAPDDPRPAALLAGLAARADRPPAIRAKARLDLDAEDARLDRPQRMAIERPARLRVEVLGLFDQLAAVIVTDGETYQVYDARRGDLEEGAVDADWLWRVARVDLAPAEAVDLILGGPRPDPALTDDGALGFEDGDVAVARRDDAGVTRERYRFDAAGRVVEATVFDAAGRLARRARFGDYRVVDAPDGSALAFAHDVRLEFPRVGARVRLTFERVLIASELPDALFVLELPDRSERTEPEPGALSRRFGGVRGTGAR